LKKALELFLIKIFGKAIRLFDKTKILSIIKKESKEETWENFLFGI